MLNLSPSNTDKYLASANLPPLSRYWFSNSGTMLTVSTGSRTLFYILDMWVSGVGWPYFSAKILVDLFSVWMNGSPTIPAWGLHAVYPAADGIDPSSTPLLTFCSVSTVCLVRDLLFLHVWLQYLLVQLVLLCGCRCHSVLSFSVCCGGRLNLARRLPLTAPLGLILYRSGSGPGFWVVPTCILHFLSVGYSSSTWLVSGV